MACGARSGLKSRKEETMSHQRQGVKGLWSPFGIEKNIHTEHDGNCNKRAKGRGGPLGIEKAARGANRNRYGIGEMGSGARSGLKRTPCYWDLPARLKAKWPVEPVRDRKMPAMILRASKAERAKWPVEPVRD